MLDLLADDSSILKAHLNSSLDSKCKLTSPDIQNKILYRRKVIFKISQAKYLAVIADESTDNSGQHS